MPAAMPMTVQTTGQQTSTKDSLQCSSTEYGQQADLKILQTLNRQSSREAFPYLLQAAESQQQMI